MKSNSAIINLKIKLTYYNLFEGFIKTEFESHESRFLSFIENDKEKNELVDKIFAYHILCRIFNKIPHVNLEWSLQHLNNGNFDKHLFQKKFSMLSKKLDDEKIWFMSKIPPEKKVKKSNDNKRHSQGNQIDPISKKIDFTKRKSFIVTIK